MTNRILSLAIIALLAPFAAHAGIIVHAGRVIDVERGKVLTDQAIHVDDGRITKLEAFSASGANGAAVVDWSKYTVVPGLIDMHTHVVDELQGSNPIAPLLYTAAQDVLRGVRQARDTVRAGFTTIRDVGTWRGFTDVALRDAIADGTVQGPRMYVAGAYVTVSGGGGEVTGLAPDIVVPNDFRRGVANSVDEVRQRVREILNARADFIKVIATGAVLTAGTEPGAPEFSEAEIRAAVEEAKLRGTFVAAHAHGAEGIKRAVRAGVRTIEHGSYLDDEGIALMKQHGTWLVADIYNGDYIEETGTKEQWPEEIMRKNRETTQTQRDGFAKAVKAGVHCAFGTDAGVYPHGDNARQFAYMVKYGMTPLQALRSATIDAATALGHEKEFGSVAAGKSADLVAVAGDPLADIRTLEHVQAVIARGAAICGPGGPACRDASPP